MQIIPPKDLSPFIKHYLFLESAGDAINRFRLFSDGNTAMVFCFTNQPIYIINDKNQLVNLPCAFVYGQLSEYRDLYLTGKTSFIIVVFQPYGINRLLGISANVIRNKIVTIEDTFGKKAISIYDKMISKLKPEARIHLLNTFFLSIATRKPHINQPLLKISLDFILQNKGATTIKKLVQHTGYTERHIERTFSECIGLGPKQFGNIVKLHSFLRLLKTKTKENNLTSLCYEGGYADQSHLIKEFRKFTGMTPSQYLNHSNRLAVNFLELNATK